MSVGDCVTEAFPGNKKHGKGSRRCDNRMDQRTLLLLGTFHEHDQRLDGVQQTAWSLSPLHLPLQYLQSLERIHLILPH